MINIDFLRNSGSLISQEYIKKNKELEQKIKENIKKKKIEYLKMSNGLKDIILYN